MKNLSQSIYHKALQKNLFPAFKQRSEKGEKRPKEDMTTWMVFQLLPLMSAEEQWEIAKFFLSEKTKKKYKGKVPIKGELGLWLRFPTKAGYLEPDVLLEFDFESAKQVIVIEVKVAHDSGLAEQLIKQEKVLKEHYKKAHVEITSLTLHEKEGLIGKNQTWDALNKHAPKLFKKTRSDKVRFWAENVQALLSRVYFLKEFQEFNFKYTAALRNEVNFIFSPKISFHFSGSQKIENVYFMKERQKIFLEDPIFSAFEIAEKVWENILLCNKKIEDCLLEKGFPFAKRGREEYSPDEEEFYCDSQYAYSFPVQKMGKKSASYGELFLFYDLLREVPSGETVAGWKYAKTALLTIAYSPQKWVDDDDEWTDVSIGADGAPEDEDRSVYRLHPDSENKLVIEERKKKAPEAKSNQFAWHFSVALNSLTAEKLEILVGKTIVPLLKGSTGTALVTALQASDAVTYTDWE